ncbi:hypothetical protein GZ998_05415 [Actinomyces sp. 594]|uniref:hypothetical protein n=1 Tax=Actinomyces sp. 594 TaxID=2057793 RepID=UPI001C586928|nr:hypothetical protein [Actinomyces sp. 594]MBW3068951.1 hypothetical protein [Actinomyces sp. 594]
MSDELIGVVGPESLSRVLAERGARVVTGPDREAAAKAVRERGGVSAVVVAGPPDAVFSAWAEAMSARVDVLGLAPGWPGSVRVPPAPVSVEDLCDALGLAPRPGDGALSVGSDGAVDGVSGVGDTSAAGAVTEVLPGDAQAAPARVPTWARDAADANRVETPVEVVPKPSASPSDAGGAPAPWGTVLLVASGRGGVGRTALSAAVASTAAARGLDTVVVDANPGPGGLAHLLRVEGRGLPTVADLAAGASPAQVVAGPEQVRAAGGVRVPWAAVLGPDPDQAAGAGASPEIYVQALAHLAGRAGLVVVDMPVWWGPVGPGGQLLAHAVGRGAAVLVLGDASREGLDGGRRLAEWARTRARTTHVLGVLNRMPARGLPGVGEGARALDVDFCAAVLPYEETVVLRAARGDLVHPLLGLAAGRVLDAIGVGGAGR